MAKQNSPLQSSMRTVLLAGVLSYTFAGRSLFEHFFPHGFPVRIPASERGGYAEVDFSNDSLQAKHGKLTKIIERLEEGQEPLLKGPETVIIGPNGGIYAISRGAKLVLLSDFQGTNDPHTKSAKTTLAADLGNGAPLGGKFTPDGNTLYIADALLGLTRIRDFDNYPNSKLELVASKVLDNGVMTPLLFADDVAIGPKTGKVYFSDATDIAPDRMIQEQDWDLMYASKVDCVRGKRTGRLLQYNPETEEVTVLARDLHFANGVGVDKDETYLVQSQTFSMRLSKYHLSGPRKGNFETIIDSHQLAGYTDGADCSWASSGASAGKCYVAVPSTILPAMKFVGAMPHPIDQFLRGLLMMLPKSLAPPPVDYGCVVEVDMETGAIRVLQDPTAKDMNFLTGVTAHDNKLYLGSLHEDVVGVYDLN